MSYKKVTLKEVAKEAGVSLITASNVMGGKNLNHASKETREKVRAAAGKLGYRPNLAARQLASQKNNVIGMLIDSGAPAFYRDVMKELEQLANDKNWRLQVGIVHENMNSIKQYVDDFLGSRIDHIICATHNYPEFGSKVPALFESFSNVVFLEEPFVETKFPVIASDHYSNYFNAVSGLIKRGRKRIVCCARRNAYQDPSYFKARDGVIDAYKSNNISFEESFWLPFESSFTESFPEILAVKPDALIVSKDADMFRALRLLKKASLKVPQDIALFSANLSEYAELADPAFSGFSYNAKELAKHIIEHIWKKIEIDQGRNADWVKYVKANLIWSESTM